VNEATNSFLTIFDNGKVLSGNEGISINDFERLEMKNLNIMSCNTGHLNHKDNVTTKFLKTQNAEEMRRVQNEKATIEHDRNLKYDSITDKVKGKKADLLKRKW